MAHGSADKTARAAMRPGSGKANASSALCVNALSVDLEDYFRQWLFRHVTTVERVIGFKRGTGGTAGVNYLRKMVDQRLFPELWDLRTAL